MTKLVTMDLAERAAHIRPQSRKRLGAGGFRVFVGGKGHRALPASDLDGRDLLIEPPLGDGVGGAGLGLQREGVLILAGAQLVACK